MVLVLVGVVEVGIVVGEVVGEVIGATAEVFLIAALIAASYLPLAYACEASQSMTPPNEEY